MKKFSSTALMLAGSVLGSGIAYAQQDAAPEQASNGAADIVVTAQRRSENVMKVPLNVTVVGADIIKNNGVSDLRDLTRFAPSVQYSSDGQFSVRGVGTATFAPTVESSVSQVVDDIVLGSRAFATAAFFDVERVEVLNGPQGLLFGKNASAGLINITTVKPKLGVTSGDAQIEVASRNRPGANGRGVDLRGGINLPVGANSAVRISGIYSNQDPVTRNIFAATTRQDEAQEKYGVRAKWLSEFDSGLSVYIIGDYFRSSGVAGTYDSTFRSLGANSQYPEILAAAGVAPGAENFLTATNAATYNDVKTGGVQANISYEFDNGLQVSNIVGWKTAKQAYQFDSDYSPVNFFDKNNFSSKYEQVSEELRVALPSGHRLSGQAGLYYFWSKNRNIVSRGGLNGLPSFVTSGFPFCVNAPVMVGPPPACNVSNVNFLGSDSDLTNKNVSYAAYGQLSYELIDGLKLTAGGRVTRDKVDLDMIENADNYFVTLGIPNNRVNESVSNTNFSWKLGLDWQATPTTLLYGFYGRGYKGPGFSNAAPAPNVSLAVQPEISDGGEVGIKTSLFDRMLTLSVSAYYTKFKDLQVQAFNLPLQTITLTNAGKATAKGIDISAQLRPFEGLTISQAATIAQARYDSFPGAQCYTSQTDPGCATLGVFDAAGRDMPLSAKFTATTIADYRFAITQALQGVVTVNYQHRSRLNTGFAPEQLIAPLDRFDASIGVRKEAWNLSLFCRNCFNQVRPYIVAIDPGDSVNRNALTYIQNFNFDSVRTIGARFGVNF